MGIKPAELLKYVIRPACDAAMLPGRDSEELLLGTALAESDCGRLLSSKEGDKLGIFMMPEDAYLDIWEDFLLKRPFVFNKMILTFRGKPDFSCLASDLLLAAAMCRLQYARVMYVIPEAEDLEEQARCWKNHYTTSRGSEQYYKDLWNTHAKGLF